VYPLLPVSLDCLSLIGPTVFSNVYLFCLSSSCVPFIVSFSGLSFYWPYGILLRLFFFFVFVFFILFVGPIKDGQSRETDNKGYTRRRLRLVFPLLSVSLDCSSLIGPTVFSNVYLFCLSSSCVPFIASFSGLSFDWPYGIL
jgi:hypothetical protein